MKKYIMCLLGVLLLAGRTGAQGSYNQRAKKYIQDYALYAIEEQKRSGIPAAITLGQGILETDAGASELMVNANNHFGIKSKTGWTGETYAHDDDAPGELFKKYNSALESYRDHSDLLHRNQRYAPLFKIPITNYHGWAMTLRKCGYATNPKYGQKLIGIIEEFGLQSYTQRGIAAGKAPTEDLINKSESGVAVEAAKKEAPALIQPAATQEAKPAFASEVQTSAPSEAAAMPQQKNSHIIVTTSEQQDTRPAIPVKLVADSARKLLAEEKIIEEKVIIPQAPQPRPDSGKIIMINNLKAFYARKGEHLLQYAIKYNVRYPVLLEMNDLPDGPLPFDGYVYLQKKHAVGLQGKHTVKQGENLLQISQTEGVQLKRIRTLNLLNATDEPLPGAVLELQATATRKPDVRTTQMTAHRTNALTPNGDTSTKGYITLNNRPKPTIIETTITPTNNPSTTAAVKADTAKRVAGTRPVRPGINLGGKPNVPAPAPVAKPVDSEALAANLPDTVIGIDEQRDWAAMHWVTPDTPKATNTKTPNQPAVNTADLARLKAELDKIVYADNSQLIAEQPQPVYKKNEETAGTTTKTYTVKSGDTAFGIAKKHNITVDQLLKWNDIKAADIKAGKTLKVSN